MAKPARNSNVERLIRPFTLAVRARAMLHCFVNLATPALLTPGARAHPPVQHRASNGGNRQAAWATGQTLKAVPKWEAAISREASCRRWPSPMPWPPGRCPALCGHCPGANISPMCESCATRTCPTLAPREESGKEGPKVAGPRPGGPAGWALPSPMWVWRPSGVCASRLLGPGRWPRSVDPRR